MMSSILLALKRRRLLFAPLVALALFALFQYFELGITRQDPFEGQAFKPRVGKTNPAISKNADGTRRVDWSRLPENFPAKRPFTELPKADGTVRLPKIQATFFPAKNKEAKEKQAERLLAVKREFWHAWQGYRKHAWKRDEVSPLSGGYKEVFGGWGATLVDALGTLWIMDLELEFGQAAMAVSEIDFSKCALDNINVFETTIRYLGGLLSAYDMSEGRYPQLLHKAKDLGEMLYHAFDTPNRMPITRWNWEYALNGGKQNAGEFVLVAELGSLTLEFTRLSQITGDPKYYSAVQKVMDVFYDQQNKTQLPGMWPIAVDARNEDFTSYNTFTLGGMADSMYEYLPKQYLLLNGASQQYRSLYETAMKPVYKHIFFRPMTPEHHDMLISGQVSAGTDSKVNIIAESQAQHLGCFTGGMVGLGAKLFSRDEDLETARRLVEGCLWGYESFPNGIMPEIFHTIRCPTKEDCEWDEKLWHESLVSNNPGFQKVEDIIANKGLPPGVRNVDDARYILRPEAIESVFYLYRLTGNATYQDRAWNMFENIIKHTHTDIANAALADITVTNPPKEDKMESFWLAETLKYFYLIFSDPDVISLDEYVFSTEAHPLRRPK